MKLRSSKASPLDSLTETAGGDDNGDPNEALPIIVQRGAPVRRKRPPIPRRPELVELVLRDMERKDLFSKDTLKALRQTSHAFKALVDGLFSSLSTVTIRNNKSFAELLDCPSTIQTMETFRYDGSQPLEVSKATALTVSNPSQLKKLVLKNAGIAFDILVHSSLPNLTSLNVSGLAKASKAMEWLCYREGVDVWPLRELELHMQYPIEHAILVSALKRLPQLQKLILRGKILPPTSTELEWFEEDSLPELETLELNINQPGHMGLLWNAKLPSLLHLSLKFDYAAGHSQKYLGKLGAPWIQQLQSLQFSNRHKWLSFSGSASILTAFRSSGLKTLVINSWNEREDVFESIENQGLTNLEVHLIQYYGAAPPRVMAALTTTPLPLPSKLTVVGGGYTLAEGDINSLSAFTQLRSLSLAYLKMAESDWKWFLVNILPKLEEFATSDKAFITSIRALDPSTNSTAPCMIWPLMQKLTLKSFGLLDILSLAPQFPSITTLSLYVAKACHVVSNPQPGQATHHEVIINAAANERAWPDLRSLSFSGMDRYDYKEDMPVVEKAWPRATIQAPIQ